MNYRHIYHAGNFADVVKHAVLALVIEHLKGKDAPFRVVDTHAGTGSYDLSDERAQRTGEWLGGIGRLIGPGAEPAPAHIAQLIAPYLGAVRALNPPGIVTTYPGSPRIARLLMRPQDRLVANELNPEDAAALKRLLGRDKQTAVMSIDGWTALKAVLPPKERRGVILIDPPFEATGEMERLADALIGASERFQTGIYLAWYPIKDRASVGRLKKRLAERLPRLLEVELDVAGGTVGGATDRMTGSGLVIHNPPFQIEAKLKMLLPWLGARMALEERKPKIDVNWLRE